MATRVIVTRPGRDALRWAGALAVRGFDAQVLSLIDIAPARDRQALDTAWQRLPAFAAAMFVSGNAAEHFFLARPKGVPELFITCPFPRAWATGPGTADALHAAGVAARLIDAPAADALQFDSEALWTIVRPRLEAGSRVLIVRGGDETGQGMGRHWLADQLSAAGCKPEFLVAYERRSPRLDAARLLLARDSAAGCAVWLFSSSEAIGNLVEALPGQSWRQARAVATHPRIAHAARAAGFAVVCVSRPDIADVVASIESIA